MRKVIALWLFCSLFAGQASAQTGEVIFKHSLPTATQYNGPGDIVPGAIAWYGLRAYNRAYATGSNNAITIRRASDNTTTTLKILSTAAVDTATAATFCASTTCFVTQWFDQSGNANHVVQATNASQPQFFLSGGLVSGKPYVQCISSVPTTLADATVTIPQMPLSFTLVGGEVTGANQGTISTNGGGKEINFGWVSPNNVQLFASGGGMGGPTASDGAWHAFSIVAFTANNTQGSVGTSRINVDTTLGGFGSIGIPGLATSSITLCEEPGFSHASDAQVVETGIWGIPFTDGQGLNLNVNAHAYWGF